VDGLIGLPTQVRFVAALVLAPYRDGKHTIEKTVGSLIGGAVSRT
jgi:hypothetical protein